MINKYIAYIKNWIKEALHSFGVDIRSLHNNPGHTLLGLRERNFKTILDVGANSGQSAKCYRALYPNAKIYCFEPLPDACETLKKWASNHASFITVYNVALGNSSGTVQLKLHKNATASSSVLASTDLAITLFPGSSEQTLIDVPMVTLDECIKNEELNRPMLVKMDVQGFELRVIEGGEKTLSKADACIIEVSIFQLYKEQATFYEINTLMHRLGFSYAGNLDQLHDSNGKAVFVDTLYIRNL